IFSAEMMALGKPVICYLRDDLRKMYPADLPIISAHPGNLAAVLEKTIKQRKEWPKLGQQGRAYAENVHDVTKITKKLMEYY
ncbi:MAG: glycosyltransferase, partial [Planctomycetes bacterium]|nr:glycosyltransferase [Planctomycetota bacterium]